MQAPGLIQGNMAQGFRRSLIECGYSLPGILTALFAAAKETDKASLPPNWVRTAEMLPPLMRDLSLKLAEGVETVLARLRSEPIDLWLITKGDLLRQAIKLAAFPHVDAFSAVEIVSRKNAAAYGAVLAENDCSPDRFTMVGDRFFEDIAPVLTIGGSAVHVPSGYERLISPIERVLPTPRVQACSSVLDLPKVLGMEER